MILDLMTPFTVAGLKMSLLKFKQPSAATVITGFTNDECRLGTAGKYT